jgi:hypothetical protein
VPKAFLSFTLQRELTKTHTYPKLSFTSLCKGAQENKHTHPKLSFPSLCKGVKNTHTHTHTHTPTQSFPFLHFAIEIKKERSTPKAFLHFASKPIKHMLSLVTCLSQINHEVPKRKERHDPNHGFCIPIYIGPLSSLISAPFPSPWSAPSWPAPPHPPPPINVPDKTGLMYSSGWGPKEKSCKEKGGTKYSKHETNCQKESLSLSHLH